TPFNIDAKLNGGYIAIGLLYGDGDFDKTLEITTRCGQDADCNPSNAGGVLGAVVGFNAIPERFKAGLGEIADEKFAYTDYSFSTLTDACTRLARRIVEANGGSIERGADGEVWHMKRQPPRPPKGLQQWIVLDNELRLRATPGLEGERGVRLQWEAVPTATRYRLVRSGAASERGETIFETEKATSYEDSAVAPGRVATYRMMVRLSDGQWHSSVPVRSFIFTPNPTNLPGATNLARSPWATPDAAVLNPTGSGLRDIGVISDGIVADQNYDSFDGKNPAQEDWYAIRFARGVRANAVEYVEGKNFHDGGWWLSLTVQYLDPETFEWRECEHVRISPDYDFEDRQDGRAPYSRWTLTFAPVACAGIRIFGRPGGEAAFTSIAELEVFYW
ncbi:MAG: ADP-ribosylglycohydrolase family protein, partial [Armatimonadota bacterium]